jgi:hypothetical protein
MRRCTPLARSLARVGAWGPLFTILVVTSAWPILAAAQPRPDRDAPSQQLASDPDRSAWDVALTVDVLGPLVGRYGAELAFAPTRWSAITVGAAWRTGGIPGDLDLTIGARWWPWSEGLEGPYLGPGLVAARRDASLLWGADVELGWQFVWDGWVVAAGARCGFYEGNDDSGRPIELGARLALGHAWR